MSAKALAALLGAALALGPANEAQTPPDLAWLNNTGIEYVTSAPDTSHASLLYVEFSSLSCFPCRPELKALQRAHERYLTDGLAVVGVFPYYDSKKDVQALLESLGVTFPVIIDAPPAAPHEYNDFRNSPAFALHSVGRLPDTDWHVMQQCGEALAQDATDTVNYYNVLYVAGETQMTGFLRAKHESRRPCE